MNFFVSILTLVEFPDADLILIEKRSNALNDAVVPGE